MSKLQNGLIPAYTECPFVSDCAWKNLGDCAHHGIHHEVDFSCGWARLLNVNERIITSTQQAEPNASCRNALRNEGKAAPRRCEICGFKECKKGLK